MTPSPQSRVECSHIATPIPPDGVHARVRQVCDGRDIRTVGLWVLNCLVLSFPSSVNILRLEKIFLKDDTLPKEIILLVARFHFDPVKCTERPGKEKQIWSSGPAKENRFGNHQKQHSRQSCRSGPRTRGHVALLLHVGIGWSQDPSF